MAFFYIIDNSLSRIGGHHYEYTRCVSQAAIDFGFSCVVGTHRRFDPTTVLANDNLLLNKNLQPEKDTGPALRLKPNSNQNDNSESDLNWRPVFRNTTYQRDSLLPGLANLKLKNTPDSGYDKTEGLLNWWNQALQLRRRRSLIRSFAYDCETFFDEFEFTTDDHVLLTTVSELELLGLAAYLANHPRTLQVNWHLQFHFDLLIGRPSEYDKQRPTVDNVRHAFMAAMARIPYHQVNFFVTSKQLADQYNRLGVGEFVPLVYPVDAGFIRDSFDTKSPATSDKNDPIKITVAGGIRREKGQREQLQQIVDQLWTEQFEPGNIQLFVQRKPGNHFKGPKFRLNYPIDPGIDDDQQPIVFKDHPCPKEDYVSLIKNSDVGLLCYDSRAYFARRAGVLCEYLAAGVPVVVPAGCWLAEQLAPLHYEYVDDLVEKNQVTDSLVQSNNELAIANVPLQGGVWSFDQKRHPFILNCDVNANINGVAFQFYWNWPQKTGAYIDVELKQFDQSGAPISASTQTVGFSHGPAPTGLVFNIDPNAATFQVRFTNAYADETASICRVKIAGLLVENHDRIPIGAVGAIANSNDNYVAAIEEVLNNINHYRLTARRFSTQWAKTHLPRRTVARLIAAERTSFNVA